MAGQEQVSGFIGELLQQGQEHKQQNCAKRQDAQVTL
jgi:hypothetical protein